MFCVVYNGGKNEAKEKIEIFQTEADCYLENQSEAGLYLVFTAVGVDCKTFTMGYIIEAKRSENLENTSHSGRARTPVLDVEHLFDCEILHNRL